MGDFDLYSLMGEEDEPTAKELAMALGGQSDRDRQFASLLQMSGADKALGGFGQTLMAGANKQRAMLAEAPGQRLSQAMNRLKMKSGQAEYDNDNAPASSVYHDLAKKFGTSLPPQTTNRQAKEMLGLAERGYAADQKAKELDLNRRSVRDMRDERAEARRLELEARAAAKQAEADAKAEKELRDRTYKLSQAVKDSVPVVSSLENISALLGPDGFDTTENIEGIGPGQGLLDLVPGGNLLRGPKAKANRAAAADLSANVLRAYSGAAASDKELLRTLERLGQGDYSDDNEFRDAVKRVRTFVALQMKTAEAGVGSDAAKRFEEEGGVTAGRAANVGKPAQSAAIAKVASDADYERLPSGAEFVGPDNVRRRKP
jgi:NADH dehydrogenase/NADH:ubiquinone oxidoreductase subunit G